MISSLLLSSDYDKLILNIGVKTKTEKKDVQSLVKNTKINEVNQFEIDQLNITL